MERTRGARAVLASILLFPARVLLFPLTAFGWLHSPDVDLHEAGPLSWSNRLKSAIWAPFRLAQRGLREVGLWLRQMPPRQMLLLAPAILMVGFFAFVMASMLFRGDQIDARYQKGIRLAVADGDFELARTYFERLRSRTTLDEGQRMQWALVLSQTGDQQRAEEILSQLAPDDQAGYGPAHQARAMSLFRTFRRTDAGLLSPDPGALQRLSWHLSQTDDQSADVCQARAMVYLAMENTDDALLQLERSAPSYPDHYLLMAEIYRKRGKPSEAQDALQAAQDVYEDRLSAQPMDHASRIALANVLVRSRQVDQAEEVLLKGYRLKPDTQIRHSLADFSIMRHDLYLQADPPEVAKSLEQLRQAMTYDRQHAGIYQRLLRGYQQFGDSPAQQALVRQALLDAVVEDPANAVAHFALSNLYRAEGEMKQATYHLEEANRLDPRMPRVCNDLAWTLAHADPADLERAEELARRAVAMEPDNPRFRDTLGTVLWKMDQPTDAATEFNRALQGMPDPRPIHGKLAAIYEQLEMPELAKKHREKAQAAVD